MHILSVFLVAHAKAGYFVCNGGSFYDASCGRTAHTSIATPPTTTMPATTFKSTRSTTTRSTPTRVWTAPEAECSTLVELQNLLVSAIDGSGGGASSIQIRRPGWDGTQMGIKFMCSYDERDPPFQACNHCQQAVAFLGFGSCTPITGAALDSGSYFMGCTDETVATLNDKLMALSSDSSNHQAVSADADSKVHVVIAASVLSVALVVVGAAGISIYRSFYRRLSANGRSPADDDEALLYSN